MSDCVSSKLNSIINLACWVATMSLTSYWLYRFFLDDDLVKVEYKKYFGEERVVFPVLSLCLNDSISEKKLSQTGAQVTVSTYLDFLKGNYFDPRMLNIKYEDIIKNMSDYIKEDYVKFRNGSSKYLNSAKEDVFTMFHYEVGKHANGKKGLFPSENAFFWNRRFYNCYSLRIPDDKNIQAFWFRMRNSIFPNGVRLNSYGLVTFLHYPNQLMVSGKTMKYMWPQQRKMDESYRMRFDINGVEVLRRRQKRSRPCSDFWAEHDNEIKTKHSDNIGCRLQYMHLSKNTTFCKHKEQMKKIFHLRFDDYGVLPPCNTMEKIYYRYTERTLDVDKDTFAKKGYFFIGISVAEDHFKEIVQTKAIDIQALIGTVGGYIGLFLGCSILQILGVIALLIKRINKWLSEKLFRSKNIVDIHQSTINNERLESRVSSPENRDNAPYLQLMMQDMLERELDRKIKVILEEKLADIDELH